MLITFGIRNAVVAGLILLGCTSLATAGPAPVTVKLNGITMLAGPAFRPFVQPPKHEPGLVKIFDNMLPPAKYPYGTYFCCIAPTIAGPDSCCAQEEWWAEAFTPTADATVTKIEVAATYAGGTNSLNIGLYNDSGGIPGSPLMSRDVKNLPKFGGCCATVILKEKSGIPVTAGTQYWVVLSTDAADTDFWGAWNYNTSDQVTKVNQAEYVNSTWYPGPIAPGVGLAVWGSK